MKRLLAMLLILGLLGAALPLTVSAQEEAPFTVSFPDVTLYVNEGSDQVTLTAYYETTVDILDGMFEVTWDTAALELQIPKKITKLCPLGNCQINADQAGTVRIAFMDTAGLDESGILFAFPFKVLNPAVGATHAVSLRFIRLMHRGDTAVGVNLVTETENFSAKGNILIAEKPVDYSALEQEVTNAVTDLSHYTESSVEFYLCAFARANQMLETRIYAQVEVDRALSELQAARQALFPKPLDKEVLQTGIDVAPSNLSDYTEESAAAFTSAYNAAIQVLNNPIATQQEVDEAAAALNAAMAALTRLPDTADVLKGDVDGNGVVDSTDARLTLQVSVGKLTEEDLTVPAAADVDGSEDITTSDARLILQYSVGKIADWP